MTVVVVMITFIAIVEMKLVVVEVVLVFVGREMEVFRKGSSLWVLLAEIFEYLRGRGW